MNAGNNTNTNAVSGTSKIAESDPSAEEKQKGQCPRGVSQEMWEKFQQLKDKRQKVSHASTQKRIRALQADVIQKVKAEMCSEEEINILKDNDVKIDESEDLKKPRKRNHSLLDTESNRPSLESTSSTIDNKNQPENWSDIKKYLGCNDHLKGIEKGRYALKSKLEEKLDEAVSSNDFKTAEELSDKLAAREFGTKITEAIDAKRYADRKKKEDDIAMAKRRKKLQWGFSEKHRWETKSNM